MAHHDFETLKQMIKGIYNQDMQDSVLQYFEHYKEQFCKCPGSIKHHHAYTGGLLDHTMEVASIAFRIGNLDEIVSEDDFKQTENDPFYICWDDKLLISSLLHDVGKIKQYKSIDYFDGKDLDTKWVYTMNRDESKLFDHAIWVTKDFRKVCGFSLPGDIEEAILTHHGGWSTNSVQMENLLDAIIHSADLISSRM